MSAASSTPAAVPSTTPPVIDMTVEDPDPFGDLDSDSDSPSVPLLATETRLTSMTTTPPAADPSSATPLASPSLSEERICELLNTSSQYTLESVCKAMDGRLAEMLRVYVTLHWRPNVRCPWKEVTFVKSRETALKTQIGEMIAQEILTKEVNHARSEYLAGVQAFKTSHDNLLKLQSLTDLSKTTLALKLRERNRDLVRRVKRLEKTNSALISRLRLEDMDPEGHVLMVEADLEVDKIDWDAMCLDLQTRRTLQTIRFADLRAEKQRKAEETAAAEESDRICLLGVIPSPMASVSMGAPVVPVSWDVPPSFDSAAERDIVGIQATETSLQREARVCNGCNGLEVPLLFESLSSEDLTDLEGLLGLNSLDREIASILAHFSSGRLVERTYNTMSFLMRLLVKIRDLQEQVRRLDTNKTTDHALLLQDTNHALDREWTAMCQYWYRHIQDVGRRSSTTMAARIRFFRNVEEGLKRRTQILQDENTRLRTELWSAQDAQEATERRDDGSALDPDDLLDFLMRDKSGVTVTSNWERLRDIFRHYAEGTTPPSDWNTQINVTAMDNVRYMPPDYVKPDPRPRNPRGGGGSGPKPSTPKAVRVLDLTGSGGSKTPGTKSRPSRTRSTSGTKRKGPQQSSSRRAGSARKLELDITEERQMLPKEHCPREDLVYGPDTDLDLAMEADAPKLVPDGLFWEDLRQDVRMLMLTGLTYEEALKLLRSDEPIHHLLPGYMVQLMLPRQSNPCSR
ncbi:hypothetical protein PHMEG_0005906 [Phytophthora megakarya]|uniref:Uncharacterized protein n=1 Tax=Phytophthora megakarya TaxID=4795 RepID=A0A225WQ93_9STRA|nr:hypothetical protein PHMEG_0005906 [Phytophthora megakarya]